MRRFAILAALLAAVALGQWSLPPYNLVISGGVTAVRAGYLMSFSEDPLVDTGTIAWDSAGFKTWYAATSTGDSITKGVVKATRVRAATIYTTNIFPTATTTHLLFALTASTSLDSVRFKATVVRGDSLAFTAVTATNFRGALTGNVTGANGATIVNGSAGAVTITEDTIFQAGVVRPTKVVVGTGDVVLQNGATIVNGHADTLTVTEAVLKWSGLVFVNGKLLFGSVLFDSSSHGTRRDTLLLWAHDTAYAIVKRP
jgi:hypothetical protein